ncbi:peptidase C15 [Leptolyngbya sp. FACHB-321]|nr:peptidase C15 [Leptolyngbya sp. FACHB-321]
MPKQLLLTSFDIWEPHHVSNASDDLLAAMEQQRLLACIEAKIKLLRKVPVDFVLAPQQVIAESDALKPDLILCCGMAESRTLLTLESNAKHQLDHQLDILWTTIDIERLVGKMLFTKVSHDAGAFVCNHLYYSVLKHIESHRLCCQCLFVHVPVLTKTNLSLILKDFYTLLQMLV